MAAENKYTINHDSRYEVIETIFFSFFFCYCVHTAAFNPVCGGGIKFFSLFFLLMTIYELS